MYFNKPVNKLLSLIKHWWNVIATKENVKLFFSAQLVNNLETLMFITSSSHSSSVKKISDHCNEPICCSGSPIRAASALPICF